MVITMATVESGKKLTKRTVDAAAKGEARYTVWDSDLKGFGLRVEPSGTKTYVVRYRVGGGRRGTLRQFKIGRAGKLTPDEARDAAKAALAQVEIGKDPQAQRTAAREVLTVAELCDLYLREGVATKKASTLQLDKIRIEGHIKPLLGRKKITEVTTADVTRMLNAIGSGKTSIKAALAEAGSPPKPGSRVRGGKGAATRSVTLLGAIYTFAITQGLCTNNPRAGVETYPDGKRTRFLSDAESARLGDALTLAAQAGAKPHHITILRLLALTGARKNEIARLQWSELDTERGFLRLKDSKTGPREIRLGPPALLLLNQVERTESPYVFPDPKYVGEPIRNLDWAWVNIRKAAGLDDVTIHDLRHSFASTGAARGSGLLIIGKLLGHSNVTSTSRYAHLSDNPLAAAADDISNAVSAAMNPTAGADVTGMKGGAR
jgi:integrase